MDSKAAEVASDVADEITEVFEISSGGRSIGMFFGGFLLGAGVGAAISYLLTYRFVEAKYIKLAEDEIQVMQDHYESKKRALDNTADKGNLEDIVHKRGYSAVKDTEPPMAVSPPSAVVEAAEEAQEEDIVEAVVVEEIPEIPRGTEEATRNVFDEVQPTVFPWNSHEEWAKRSPVRPYVIHMDEREEKDYDEITLTYYEADDVLADEQEDALSDLDRERLVGEANLERFGHGSNSRDVVYIRNDKLEMQYEVVLSANSYAEEVHGFEHTDTRKTRRERKTFDDE